MPKTRAVLLEVIVSSLDDARAAAAGGADRFELCSALALGGLTPSLGTLVAIKAEIELPVMFMVRPREAGMDYTEGELTVIERGRIEVLPGGGIRAGNVRRVVAETAVDQVHINLADPATDHSVEANRLIRFGAFVPASDLQYRAVTGAAVRDVRNLLDA